MFLLVYRRFISQTRKILSAGIFQRRLAIIVTKASSKCRERGLLGDSHGLGGINKKTAED